MKQHETGRFRSGHLAILVLLIVGLAGAFPVFARECIEDWQCDDGFLCNGWEVCINGKCETSLEPVCPDGKVCNEDENRCLVACTYDSDCIDGYFCNGEEWCDDGCHDGYDPCAGMFCDEVADVCTSDLCLESQTDKGYVSLFTGLNCTGKESYYLQYQSGIYYCDPDNPEEEEEVYCGAEQRTETNISFSKWGDCSGEAWPNGSTVSELVRVYRQGIPPDGDTASHFTGPGCTGTELYRIDPTGGYLCSPDYSYDAVCGKAMYKETVRSVMVDGVCQDTWPEGIELNGFVKVYRLCGVDGTDECGDGECEGNETCLSCPEDCTSCCEEPDGEQISYFTEYSCEGTEYYEVPADDFEYECAPANPEGAVCGTVLNTVEVRSYGTPDWCVHSLPFYTQKRVVRVYREGCVDEEAPECGDGTCNGVESCAWCPGDCGGPCSGNGFCDIGECSAYPDDCSIDECCGNGVCDDMGDNPPENCLNCEEDCGECPPPPDPYCGDGICNGKENPRTCPQDCKREPGGKPAT